jgi:hypothetical protein
MTMLDPTQRTLYTSALRPPPGFIFDQAVAATYSLDLSTLLAVPMYLALSFGEEKREEILRDPVALLEAVQRTATRIGIYCDQARIHVPSRARNLFALLEPVVREVRAPRGGAFHPKLWLLRFLPADGLQEPLLRLVVLSRNLTADRSWDLSLVLEGRPGARVRGRAENRALRDLLLWLQDQSPDRDTPDLRLLALEAHATAWELPGDFERVQFHLLGTRRTPWLPPASSKLAVVSPFCSGEALRRLSATTSTPVALVSRPEELAYLSQAELHSFPRILTLAEQAESDDGEEPTEEREHLRGLHAKAYLLESGWNTHLIMGSANATDAALIHGFNVEILAELVGKRSRVGRVEDLLSAEGMGAVLEDFCPPEIPVEPDPAKEAAIRALEAARDALARADLELGCEPVDDNWRVVLKSPRPVSLKGIDSLSVWLVSHADTWKASGLPLTAGEPIVFPTMALESVSGFVAFELHVRGAPERLRFVLNLPLEGLPEDRGAAIIRSIVRDREAFLRYLLLLLGQFGAGPDGDVTLDAFAEHGSWGGAGGGGLQELPLLEDMTRAFCRDTSRLRSVQRLVRDLNAAENSEVVPPEFLELWQVFESALEQEEAR